MFSFQYPLICSLNELLNNMHLFSEPVDGNYTEELGSSIAEEEIIIKSGGSHDLAWDSFETSMTYMTFFKNCHYYLNTK